MTSDDKDENQSRTGQLMNLAFGIAEAIILSQNTDAKYDDCTYGGIWYCVLVMCLFHWIAFVFAFQSPKPINEAHMIGLGVSIWALVVFFETSDECKDDYEYTDLWNMLMAEAIITLIGIGILGLAFLWLMGCMIAEWYR